MVPLPGAVVQHRLADQLDAVAPPPPGLRHRQQGDPAPAPVCLPAVVKGHRAYRRLPQVAHQRPIQPLRGPPGPRRREVRLLRLQRPEVQPRLQAVGPLFHRVSPGEGRVRQVGHIVPPDHLQPPVLRPQQRHGGVAAGGRPAQLLQGDPLKGRQQQPDGTAVGEHRRRLSLVGRRDVPHCRQQPVLNRLGRLRPLHVPQVKGAVEVPQLFRVLPGDLPPGLFLPDAHADLPQVPPPVQGQPPGPVDGAGRGAGAVEVAGVNRVHGDAGKPALQRLDLPPAPVRDDAVGLPLGDAVQVSLRLRVADQIDGGHGSLRLVKSRLVFIIPCLTLFGKSAFRGFFPQKRPYYGQAEKE